MARLMVNVFSILVTLYAVLSAATIFHAIALAAVATIWLNFGWQLCQGFHARRHRKDDYAPYRRRNDPIVPLPNKADFADAQSYAREVHRRIDAYALGGDREPVDVAKLPDNRGNK